MRITSTLHGGFHFTTQIRGHQVTVDLPTETGGTDVGPMPPELIAAALGTCVGIYSVMFCTKHNIPTEGVTVHTDWEKADDPSRISKLDVVVEVPAGIPEAKYAPFMKTIEQCMVHQTLCTCPLVSMALSEESLR